MPFDFDEAEDPTPTVVARDAVKGVVYEACWNSVRASGSGGWITTRHLFVLCDGTHHWHLLGEGPTTSAGSLGYSESTRQVLKSTATWRDKIPLKPQFRFTIEKERFLGDGGESLPPAITLVYETSQEAVSDTGLEGFQNDEQQPGFESERVSSVSTARDMSMTALLDLLSGDLHNLVDRDPDKQKLLRRRTAAAIRAANPNIGETVPANQQITIPASLSEPAGK